MAETNEGQRDPVARVAALGEPVRRRVYEHVAAAGPVDRDAVAEAVGIGRSLAAFHLDRLADAGLLVTSFRRRSGRTGPGAGRPAKFYARPSDTIAVSLPPRRYELAADLFADALESTLGGRDAVIEAARELGRETAGMAPRARPGAEGPAARTALLQLLDERGFEPRPREDGGVDLGNCPFRDLRDDHRELTCGANLALLASMVAEVPGAGLVAERQDPPEPCCVTLRRT